MRLPVPPRLGLPWQLPHYRPLNGPHPLVCSFLDGNAAVRPVVLEACEARPGNAVVTAIARQAQALAPDRIETFVNWLNPGDQAAIEAQSAGFDALFLHTTPLYAGSRPWIFHFESVPSLFMPFAFTGATRGLDVRAQGWFRLLRERLADPRCLRIFSHMRGSLAMFVELFDDAAIAAKCHHVPLGIALRDEAEIAPKFEQRDRLRILFTNSLHGNPDSFYLRGGHHLLSAFARLRRDFPNAELTVLSAVPEDLMGRFSPSHFIGVNWINHRLDDATLDGLFLGHHLFALPAAGLHSHSLLRAMAHGCVPVVSDALGYEEYVAALPRSTATWHGVRELVYRDEPGGWVSDDYATFRQPSETLAARLCGLLAERADLPALHRSARANLEHCRQHHAPPASHRAFERMLAGA